MTNFKRLLLALSGIFLLSSLAQGQTALAVAVASGLLPAWIARRSRHQGRQDCATALNPDNKLKVIGGTVYFAVFDRIGGTPGDPWNTGLGDLKDRFMVGKDAKDMASPLLATESRYLYLYEIVNDRGMDPTNDVVPAVVRDPKSEPIGAFDLKLPVDAKRITSWGYFKDAGFSVMVAESAAGQAKATDIRLAVSAAGSLLDQLPNKAYQPNAPAQSLIYMNSTLRVGPSTLNLDKSLGYQNLLKRKEVPVGSEKNFLEAVKSARRPDAVQLLNLSMADKDASQIRVLWQGDNMIKLGQHSVLFGFTSDSPPTTDSGRIEAVGVKVPELKPGEVRPVADGEFAMATLPAPMGAVNAANAGKAGMPILAGFTKPGNPSDEITDKGTVLPIAYKAGYKRKVLGGTVYFAVFERTGSENDAWGTGFGNLNSSFSEGYSFKGDLSPHLDTRSKYLYLYQIVNDRGMEKPTAGEIAGAGLDLEKKEPNIDDIAAYALRLSVDPRYITSWGHFKGAAFTAQVPNRTRTGDVIPAADGPGDSKIAFAVSAYQPILADIPIKRYINRSPAYPLPTDMVNSFGVGPATLNLKTAEQHKALAQKRADNPIAMVGFENNILNSAVTARTPDFVQIMYGTDEEGNVNVYQGMDEIGPVVFRVDFRNPMLAGQHSVVFGFTTDLPPQDEPIRVEDIITAREGGIGAVADGVTPGVGAGTGNGIAPAQGVAPGPIAPAAAGGGGGGGGGFGGMGGFPSWAASAAEASAAPSAAALAWPRPRLPAAAAVCSAAARAPILALAPAPIPARPITST